MPRTDATFTYGPGMSVWGLDWGDVPTWIAALFSGGAFTGALLLFRIESRRDREQVAIRRQSQASLITAWVAESSEGSKLAVYIQNSSSACVYDVWVVYTAFEHTLDHQSLSVLWPSLDKPRTMDLTERSRTRYLEILPTIQPSRWDKDRVRPTLYFRDCANVRWMRDRDGRLSELTGTEWVPEDILRDDAERTAERYRRRMEGPTAE